MERHGYRTPEVLFRAALVMLRDVADEQERGDLWRFRELPRSRLRAMRRGLAEALELAHLACALQEAENENARDLVKDLTERANDAAARRRREGTREAERVRLVKAKARREGREPTDAELRPWEAEV